MQRSAAAWNSPLSFSGASLICEKILLEAASASSDASSSLSVSEIIVEVEEMASFDQFRRINDSYSDLRALTFGREEKFLTRRRLVINDRTQAWI